MIKILNTDQIDQAKEMLKTNIIKDVAKHFNVSFGTIQRLSQKSKIRQKRKKIFDKDILKNDILQNQLTAEAISKKHNISLNTFYYYKNKLISKSEKKIFKLQNKKNRIINRIDNEIKKIIN